MTAASQRDDLSPLKRALYEIRSLRAKVDDLERDRLEPIAIVGAGLRFPGNADRLADFWSLLFSGVDAVGEIPPELKEPGGLTGVADGEAQVAQRAFVGVDAQDLG